MVFHHGWGLYQKNFQNLECLIHFPAWYAVFYKLCSKRFGLNIWVPIPIQWFENMSGCNTAYAKNQLHPCLLWTCFAMTSKNDTTFMQKITLIPPSFLKYYKDIANLFWVHWAFARPHPPKAIAPTCRKLWCLSKKNSTSKIPHFS